MHTLAHHDQEYTFPAIHALVSYLRTLKANEKVTATVTMTDGTPCHIEGSALGVADWLAIHTPHTFPHDVGEYCECPECTTTEARPLLPNG